jgi:hypothetical protein
MGFLPEALRNYLLRLGWGHGDDEIISTEQAIAWFDLAGVGKGAARFDLDRLTNLNAHYLRQMDAADLADAKRRTLMRFEVPGQEVLHGKLDSREHGSREDLAAFNWKRHRPRETRGLLRWSMDGTRRALEERTGGEPDAEQQQQQWGLHRVPLERRLPRALAASVRLNHRQG